MRISGSSPLGRRSKKAPRHLAKPRHYTRVTQSKGHISYHHPGGRTVTKVRRFAKYGGINPAKVYATPQYNRAQLRAAAEKAALGKTPSFRFFDPAHVLKIGKQPNFSQFIGGGTGLTNKELNKVTGGNLPFQSQIQFKKGTPEQKYNQIVHHLINEAQKHKQSKQANLGVDIYGASKAVTKGAAAVLNQTLRPIHGIAAGVDAAVTHKGDLLGSAGEGFVKNKGPLFSDVLKHAGVKNKAVRAVVGGVADIAVDPTTYLTFGESAVAKTAAELGAKRGLRVGLHGHIPFTNATGDIGFHIPAPKTVRKVTRKVRESRPVQGLGEALAPDFRPSHLTPTAHTTIRRATRRARASEANAERAAVKHARAIKKVAGSSHEQHLLVDAIEAKTVHNLPPDLQATAKKLKVQFGSEFRAKNVRGLLDHPFAPRNAQDAQAFFPHPNQLEFLSQRAARKAGGSTRVAPERFRTVRKPMSVLRNEAPHVYEQNLAKVAPSSALKTSKKASIHDVWQQVASTGRKVTPDAHINLGDGELVYEITPHGPKAIANSRGRFKSPEPDLGEMQKIVDGKRKGNFVILHHKTVENVQEALARSGGSSGNPIGKVFDRTTGTWKLAAISTPAYHARNLYGDTLNASLGDATARSFGQSFKGMRALHAREKFRGSKQFFTGGAKLQKAQKLLSKEIKLGKAGKTTMGQELAHAEREGAIRTGQAGADVRELLGGKPGKAGRVRAVSEYREDFPRFATYLSARKRGLSPAAASEWSLKHHFDYGDLTRFERDFARRAFPFYTFFARNTRLQATKLFQRPGKFSTMAKVLNEAAKAAGLSSYDSYVSTLPEYQQRGLPIPVKIGGHVYNIFISPPTTDVQNVADLATGNANALFQNFAQRVTFWKSVPELILNYSTFFRGPIQNDKSPLVPAPDFLGSAPQAVKDALGVRQYIDHRTNKKIWGWPAKVDYVARQLPQTGALTGALTSIKGSRGQSGAQQLLGISSGLRVVQNRPLDNAINHLYSQRTTLDNRRSSVWQRLGKDSTGHNRNNAETKKLTAQLKALDLQIGKLRMKRKDPLNQIPTTQRPRKSDPLGLPSGQGSNPLGLPSGGGSNPLGLP